MSHIGKPVMHKWDRDCSVRFGRIVDQMRKNKWTYVKVDWKDDDIYEEQRNYVLKLRNVQLDESTNWYRIDHINVIEPAKMISVLESL